MEGWICSSKLPWALIFALILLCRGAVGHKETFRASLSQSTTARQPAESDYGSQHRLLAVRNQSQVTLLAVRSRPDPTNGLKDYTGGYNVTNSHYWASAAWIAVGTYIAAIVWLLLGLLLAGLACCGCCSSGKYRAPGTWVSYGAVIIFSLLSIIGSVLLYAGDISANNTIASVVATLEGSVQTTVGQVHNVTAAGDTVAGLLQPSQPNVADGIRNAISGLNVSAVHVQEVTSSSAQSVATLKNDIKWILVGVSVFHLLLLLLSTVAIPFGWTSLLLPLAVLGWVAVALTLCVCGFYVTAHVVVRDSCAAMGEYNVSLGGSSLDVLLPCVDLAATEGVVNRLQGAAFSVAQETQSMVSAVQGLPVCNPFLGPPTYSADPSCPPNQITDLATILLPRTCPENNITTVCREQGQIVPNSTYTTLVTYSEAVSLVVAVLPEVDTLLNCTFVTTTFASLVDNDCHNADSSLKMTWASLILLSVTMMVLASLWLIIDARLKTNAVLGLHSLEMGTVNDAEDGLHKHTFREP